LKFNPAIESGSDEGGEDGADDISLPLNPAALLKKVEQKHKMQ